MTVGTITYAQLEAGSSAGPYVPVGPEPVLNYYAQSAAAYLWSDNPALCTADWLNSTVYGARRPVDWQLVIEAADYDDGIIGGEKRCLITLTIAESRNVEEWIDVMRGYVPAWVDYHGHTALLIADMPRAAADHVLTAANIDQDPLPAIFKRGIRNRPNVVEIGYFKTDVKPWAMDYAVADMSPTTRRKARINMPGIRRYSQAYRFAVERLNHYNLEAIETVLGVFEDGLKVTLGDRFTVTDDIGLTATPMRGMGRVDRGYGRWLIGLRKYDANVFSDTVQTTPDTPDTGLPSITSVAAPTSLVLAEEVYLEKDQASDSLSRGFIYQSRVKVSWTASTHYYPVTYRVRLMDGLLVVDERTTKGLSYSSPPAQQGRGYTVEVTAFNDPGFVSSILSDTITALGKLLPPGNVPSILSAFEVGGTVYFRIEAAVDIDIDRYEWKYGDPGSFNYDTATLIDRIDGLRAQFSGLPIGTWRFGVKALDSVGLRSPTATTVDVTITSDSDAFIQDREFVNPNLTGANLVAIPMLEGVWKQRWATSVASDQWGTVMPDPLSSGANPVASYHASATSKFVGESWDIGTTVTGDWQLTPNATALSGSLDYYLETSDNGSDWTRQPGQTWKGATRFIRPVIEALTTSTMLVDQPPKISLIALARSESGQIAVDAAGTLVELDGAYVGAQDLQLTVLNPVDLGGALNRARMPVADRVLLHPQDGLVVAYDFNGSGDNYLFWNIHNSARVIASGDYLEYDVFIDPSNPVVASFSNGGMRVTFTDVTDTNLATDQNGYNGYAPSVAMDAIARGQWYSRKISLAAYVGKTVNLWQLVNHGNAASGAAKILYRSIRVTDGAGADRLSIWSSGEPAVNSLSANSLVTNSRVGPANSFKLYVFDAAGTAITQAPSGLEKTQYAFKGF